MIPPKYQPIWDKAKEKLKQGRPDDLTHAEKVMKTILEYKGNLPIDQDILIPVAIMHDIGHCMILPEYFKYISGGGKLKNGKLAHMLIGAKIAKDILQEVGYDEEKSKEIIEIIALHDADQLEEKRPEFYNTENKRIFHDFDCLDRYNKERIDAYLKAGLFKTKEEMLKILTEKVDDLFIEEIKTQVKKQLKEL